jgi:hypothetical protein
MSPFIDLCWPSNEEDGEIDQLKRLPSSAVMTRIQACACIASRYSSLFSFLLVVSIVVFLLG